jgi:hypothetical protein
VAMIGTIKEFVSYEEGQIAAIIADGCGVEVTATIMPMGNLDFHPLVGDTVVFHYAGQEVVVTAVFSEDSTAAPGQAILFARQADGNIVASILLHSNGEILVTLGNGKTMRIGNGTDFVAMSAGINTYLSTLSAAVAPGGTPVVTPAVGQPCPVATAIVAALLAAYPPSGTPACQSSNLQADP